jgi:DNA-binding PadR family transcriptional regulator
MAPKELLALRLLIDNPRGLYGSQLVHLAEGKLNRGTVYMLLERMVDKGFVREVEEPGTASLQLTRTRHLITAQGKAAYRAFLEEQGLEMVPFATSGST